MASDAVVFSAPNPLADGKNHYEVPNTNNNHPQQQKRHIPIPPPPSQKYSHPPISSCPLPPPTLKTKTYACHAIASTQSTATPVKSSIPALTSHSASDFRTQTMHKILALLDKAQELMLCILQLASSQAMSIASPLTSPSPTPVSDYTKPLSMPQPTHNL